jgi:hypothetical protein
MMDEPGQWIGEPQIVVNMNVSWLRYASTTLERIPESRLIDGDGIRFPASPLLSRNI